MLNSTELSKQEILEARYYLYTVLQILLGEAPTVERLKVINFGLIKQALGILQIECGIQVIEDLKHSLEDVDAAKDAYARLFLGPSVLPVPMWESVYLADENTLFTNDTLGVRSFYRKNGVLPKLYPRVADDHISFELGFMALLSKQMVESYIESEEHLYVKSSQTSRDFLEEHLGKWVDAWSSAMEAEADSKLYASTANIAAHLVESDIELLEKEA